MGDGVENLLAINERKRTQYLAKKIPLGEVVEVGEHGIYKWKPKKTK